MKFSLQMWKQWPYRILNLFWQVVWEHIWKLDLFWQVVWEHIWKLTGENNCNVTIFFSELTRPVLKLMSWSDLISTRPHWVTRPKNFIETDTETFFRDQNFWDRYRDFFSRPNLFETDTETFFRDQMSLRLIPRLFLRPNFLRPIPRLFLDQIFQDED